MQHWQAIKDAIEIVLQALTIIVLWITWQAIRRQARASEEQASAAEKLTKATEQQIETAKEQAKAAMEQVDVAKRQITESLRPMLTLRASVVDQFTRIEVQNDGGGPALDAWWSYGKFGAAPMTIERNRLQSGIIPPTRSAEFLVRDSRAFHEQIVIVYTSLAGNDSVTVLRWDGRELVPTYIADADEWTHTLLGKCVGP